MLHAEAFSDPALCRSLLRRITDHPVSSLRFMEVCGTHTTAIYRAGLSSLLPPGFTHLSGPGCPVCVTHEREIALCLELAGKEGVCVATFGDLMRVPGPEGVTLQAAKAQGADVEVVYSPLDALALARKRPGSSVVFLGIGFETTAPAVAATIQAAAGEGITGFSVLSLHKLVPPVLEELLGEQGGDADPPGPAVDAFLLPGHVATILGLEPFRFLAARRGKPAVVAGFEAADILQALIMLLDMRQTHAPAVLNQYARAVDVHGNPRARAVMDAVFEPVDTLWRGMGVIPSSGLAVRGEYAAFDAWTRLSLSLPEARETPGCGCGNVLRGKLRPGDCPLFGRVCTPSSPVGPCMVSTEGSCAAAFQYQEWDGL